MFLFLAHSSDRKRLQDREEIWQRLEQQALQNYANLTAQGAVSAPMPHLAEPISAPLGMLNFSQMFSLNYYKTLALNFN